jgi:hypothetical protein
VQMLFHGWFRFTRVLVRAAASRALAHMSNIQQKHV